MAMMSTSVTAMATQRLTRTTVLGERNFFQKRNVTNKVTIIPTKDKKQPTTEIQERAVRWLASVI